MEDFNLNTIFDNEDEPNLLEHYESEVDEKGQIIDLVSQLKSLDISQFSEVKKKFDGLLYKSRDEKAASLNYESRFRKYHFQIWIRFKY